MVFCNHSIIKFLKKYNDVTILILVDGFLQLEALLMKRTLKNVTILILVDGFLQYNRHIETVLKCSVTILILVDGFLQYNLKVAYTYTHNKSQSLF